MIFVEEASNILQRNQKKCLEGTLNISKVVRHYSFVDIYTCNCYCFLGDHELKTQTKTYELRLTQKALWLKKSKNLPKTCLQIFMIGIRVNLIIPCSSTDFRLVHIGAIAILRQLIITSERVLDIC